MQAEDLQVLAYAVKFGGAAYGSGEASYGIEQRYGLELSDDMARLVDKLYNVSADGDYDLGGEQAKVHLAIKMIRALAVTRPQSIEEAEAHIELLNRFVPTVRRDADATTIENNADDAFDMSFLASVVAANPNGTLYVTDGAGFHADKVQVIHDIHAENAVVGIEDDEIRESLTNSLEAETLDGVSLAPGALKALGVSEDTRQTILGRSGNVTDLVRTLKYHLARLV